MKSDKSQEEATSQRASGAAGDILPKTRVMYGIGLLLWVLLGFVTAQFIVGVPYLLLVQAGMLTASTLLDTVIAAVVYTLTLGIVIGVPYKWLGVRVTKKELGLTRWPNLMDVVYTPIAFIVYMMCAAVLTMAVMVAFPNIDMTQEQQVGFDDISQGYEYVLAFLTLVIIAPVAEEVLIRGYLYGRIRKYFSVVAAAAATAVLFSAMHVQLNVAISLLPIGIILVVLREKTGSIWAGIFLHMLKNGIAYYLLFINPILPSTIGA